VCSGPGLVGTAAMVFPGSRLLGKSCWSL
jgi:hypothetical protein